MLFNLYSVEIIKRAMGDKSRGFIVNGVHINNIRYADDTALISTNLKGFRVDKGHEAKMLLLTDVV